MRLAAVYNVFDGEELLEGSIRQIRPLVDVVIIVYQLTSNFGEEYHKLYITLRELELAGLVDHFELYQPTPVSSGHYKAARLEAAKRNKGINMAKDYGCTHYLCMDCDEYYVQEEFSWAKTMISRHGYQHTFASMATYFKYPSWLLYPHELYQVPFIQELDHNETRHVGWDNTLLATDPTRTPVNLKSFNKFDRESLLMHHFSWVRRDIGRKLRNSSANDLLAFRKRVPDLINEFHAFTNEPGQLIPWYRAHEIREVQNQFNIITPFKKI